MTRAYYNEIEPFAAEWLRNLIKKGLIADGEVDTRSIVDVRRSDLDGFAQCHFFAGIGGWSYALRKAGWADDRAVWTGSCPCQPFSLAGKQKGFDDARHLWPVWRDLISDCEPPVIFGEQVASATEWLGLVRRDLEALEYAVGAMPIQAASAGADHLRDRYWFVARDMANGHDAGSQGRRLLPECPGERVAGQDGLADADGIGSDKIDPDARRRSERSQASEGTRFGCSRDVDLADTLRCGSGDGTRSGDRTQAAAFGDDGDSSRASTSIGLRERLQTKIERPERRRLRWRASTGNI